MRPRPQVIETRWNSGTSWPGRPAHVSGSATDTRRRRCGREAPDRRRGPGSRRRRRVHRRSRHRSRRHRARRARSARPPVRRACTSCARGSARCRGDRHRPGAPGRRRAPARRDRSTGCAAASPRWRQSGHHRRASTPTPATPTASRAAPAPPAARGWHSTGRDDRSCTRGTTDRRAAPTPAPGDDRRQPADGVHHVGQRTDLTSPYRRRPFAGTAWRHTRTGAPPLGGRRGRCARTPPGRGDA